MRRVNAMEAVDRYVESGVLMNNALGKNHSYTSTIVPPGMEMVRSPTS